MTYAVPSQDPERLDCGSSSPQVSQPSGAQPKVAFTHREHVGIQSIRGFGRACSQGGTGDGGGLVRIDRQGLAIRDSAANYDRLTRASPPVRVQVCTHLHVEPKLIQPGPAIVRCMAAAPRCRAGLQRKRGIDVEMRDDSEPFGGSSRCVDICWSSTSWNSDSVGQNPAAVQRASLSGSAEPIASSLRRSQCFVGL